jgi:5-formyltetrahydrofolate cyclo-ligase
VEKLKDGLRAQFKKSLSQLPLEEKQSQSTQIVESLLSYLNKQSGVWTLFSPLNDEPNLLSLFEKCRHLTWVFPKVMSKTAMSFFPLRSLDELVASQWGLAEPQTSQEAVSNQQIKGCLVPGLAFDELGTRLGRGGGFYDRFLQSFKGLKLGVTFDCGLVTETLPRQSHDQHMHIVISPSRWIEVEKSEVTHGI